MGVLYAKVAGAWEPITGSAVAVEEVWVGTNDPRGTGTPAPEAEIWFDTTTPPGTLKAWDGTAWQTTGGSTVTPGGTVVDAAAFGALGVRVPSVVGTSADFARADHSHGAPPHTGAEHAHVTPNDLAVPTADVSWGGFGINDVLDPVLAQDAATKQYVDDEVGTAATDAGLLVDDMTIAVVPTTSLTAAKTGTSATGDLTWTITLDSLTLSNTITTPVQADPNTPLIAGEAGDVYINTGTGEAWISDGAAWTQLTPPATGTVTAVTAGNGIAVDATTPSVPVVSALLDPTGSAALTVSATGIKLDETLLPSTDLTVAAGAGLTHTAGVLDVVGGAGLTVTADAVAVAFPAADAATVGVADEAARSDHPGLTEVYVGGNGGAPGTPGDPDIDFPGNTFELWFDPGGGLPFDPTGVTPGSPGAFTPANATIPANLTELESLGSLGQPAAEWAPNQWVVLGDASWSRWDGQPGNGWEDAPQSIVDEVSPGSPGVLNPPPRPNTQMGNDPRWGNDCWGIDGSPAWEDWEFVEVGPPTGVPNFFQRWNSTGWSQLIPSANLAALQALLWTPPTPFGPDDYIPLADATYATWDGTTWALRAEPIWP